MAETSLDAKHDSETSQSEQDADSIPLKPSLQNGNPFLEELEKSLDDHRPPPHAEATTISNEIPNQESLGEERNATDSGPPDSTDAPLDDGNSEGEESSPKSREVNAEEEEEEEEEEDPCDVDPLQRASSSESPPETPKSATGHGDHLAGSPNDDGRGDSDAKGDEEVVVVDLRPGDQESDVEVLSEEKSQVKKNPEQAKAKEASKLPQAKSSPRRSLSSAGDEKPKPPPAAGTTEPAIASLETPKKRHRSNPSRSRTDGDKSSLAISKTTPQASPKSRASSKTRIEPRLVIKSAELPFNKSPSPGSTPCSSVPASIDGDRAATSAYRNARSKIGSLDNTKHTPGGGNVRIQPAQKVDLTNVSSKCGSKDNMKYTPGGGQRKIEHKKLEWSAESKVGSMANAQYKPGGGDIKIESVKLDFKDKAQPKVASKDNIEYKPGGGSKKVIRLIIHNIDRFCT